MMSQAYLHHQQQQQPPRFAQYGGHQHQQPPRRSNDWRGSAVGQSYAMPAAQAQNGFQTAGRAFAGQTQPNYDLDAYRIQQAQMSIQLESMKLQNIEMQERLMAAVQQQRMQQQQQQQQQQSQLHFGVAPVAQNFVDPRGQYHAPQPKSAAAANSFAQDDQLREQSRRDAVLAAQRGHLRRSPSPEPTLALQQQQQTPPSQKRASRLSFNGAHGDQLAERALARKASHGALPRPTSSDLAAHSNNNSNNNAFARAQPAYAPGHNRGQASVSSTASGQSVILSDERRELFSPHGPTIFLSSPGETFPAAPCSSSLKHAAAAAAVVVSDSDSSALSSGSDSPTLESGSSSVTSLASHEDDHKPFDMAALSHRLNPDATAFTPTPTASMQQQQQQQQSPPSRVRPASRVFSGPANKSLTYIVRQPRGPAQEDELVAENFKGRQRKQALSKLKRRSFTPAA